MLNLAVFGAGRIGRVHAVNLAGMPDANLKYIADPAGGPARTLAAETGAAVTGADEIFADDSVDAIVIASATGAHGELLRRAAEAGKAVFCEKPVSLDFAETTALAEAVRDAGVPVMMGFQRRYDPDFRAMRERIRDGSAGRPEQVLMITRDPAPPPLDYLKTSGGMVRDQAIHDFDMARYLLDEAIVEVSARGSALVSDDTRAAHDVDTLQITMISESGRQVLIANSRRSPVGYDQRVEALCSAAVLNVDNRLQNTLSVGNAGGTRTAPPENNFTERYADAYRMEMAAMVSWIRDGTTPLATIDDGVEAQRLAESAVRSLATGRPVEPATIA